MQSPTPSETAAVGRAIVIGDGVSFASLPLAQCVECAAPLSGRRKLFCSRPCTTRWNNRQLKRGQVIVTLVQAWAATRHAPRPQGLPASEYEPHAVSTYARAEMTELARRWNAEDLEAGRASAADVIARGKMASGWRACDLD